MKQINAGIIGLGRIGMAHLEALLRLPGVSVQCVCGHDAAHAKAIAAQYAIPHHCAQPDRLIEAVDAVHNCTPNAIHDEINGAVIAAGRHLYAEKPLSGTYEGALSTYRRAEQAGIVHALNHQYRMYGAVQEMRARRKAMGRVFFVQGHYRQQSGLFETGFRAAMADGGLSWALSDIGTHLFDLARHVLGAEIARVFARTETVHPVRTRPDGARIRVSTDDLCAMLLEFEDGALGAFTISKVAAGHLNDLALSIEGQHFSLSWAQENPSELRIGHPSGQMELLTPTLQAIHPVGWMDALTASVAEFYSAVRGAISPAEMRCATLRDGAVGMALVKAALESARTGTWARVARI